MRRVPIEVFIQECNSALLLDVRSPSEYNHAHIPGAISMPLFSDEERKVVGTAYKQQSREAAIKIGLDYFGPKMRGMIENVEQTNKSFGVDQDGRTNKEANYNNKEFQTPTTKPQIFIYCWRGGMRSGAVSWLLNLYGFEVTVLAGGYKAFRNYVLQSFEQPYPFKILGGYTGSGKTEVLSQLKQQRQWVIDLETLASHKGSAFGSINMPQQPSQEMFENLLSLELRKVNSGLSIVNSEPSDITPDPKLQTPNYCWLEDESQRIGQINIPGALWNTMRSSPIYFLEIPFEERLQHIMQGYSLCGKEELSGAIDRIKKRLGPMETKISLQHLEEGNIKECFRILLTYYDKQYNKGLYNRDRIEALLTTIACKTVTPNNASCLAANHKKTITWRNK